MQTSFAVVVSGFGLNVKLKFGAVVKLFNYIIMEALVNIRSL